MWPPIDPEVRVSTRMLRSKRKDAGQPEKIKGGVVIPGGIIKKVSGKDWMSVRAKEPLTNPVQAAPEIKIDLTDMEVGEDFETIHRVRNS